MFEAEVEGTIEPTSVSPVWWVGSSDETPETRDRCVSNFRGGRSWKKSVSFLSDITKIIGSDSMILYFSSGKIAKNAKRKKFINIDNKM